MANPAPPSGSTSRAPATGERTALRGYRRQYDHIAALVYDALLSDSLLSLRLSDPSVGRVDDLVLELRGEIHGYQFKSAESPGTITLNDIVKPQRTRSGGEAPSLTTSLADGWLTLARDGAAAYVHLVTDSRPSVHDHVHNQQPRPTPDHFTAFIARVLRPISSGDLHLDQIADEWKPAIAKITSAASLPDDKLDAFLRHLRLDCDTRSPLPDEDSVRRRDLVTLSDALYRLVSAASDVVVLDRDDVLSLVGWGHRPRLRSTHEFPVDLDSYSPLTAAIDRLEQLLDANNSGYLAVVGPPGAGKSTLLSQALSGRRDRVLKYFAYIPGTSSAQTRLSAGNFLHDLVLMLGHDGLPRGERHLVSDDLAVLRQQLAAQLDVAAVEFETSGRRTILMVDGLDHVERDDPTGGFLHELPRPTELPSGVIVIIGSRTLTPLGPFARQQVMEREGVIDLQQHRLSVAATIEICQRVSSIARFEPSVHERIATLSDGHPLALAYLLNRLRDIEIDAVNQALDSAPPYSGDIAGEYRAVWDTIADNFELLEVLAVCARLRVGFTQAWLRTWASGATVSLFEQRMRYLFRRHHDGLRFFHDSFRQFAVDHTSHGDGDDEINSRNAEHHGRVADLCAASDDHLIKAEELHHRASSGDGEAVLRLARPTAFREQLETFRAPALIRSDISEALAIAAERGDIVAMLRLILSQSELIERESVLESVDIPAALFEAGLVDEAVAYVAGDPQRAPLAHAYGLASSLAASGDPTARSLFDRVERGLDDDRITTAGQQDAAAIAWAGAAPWFRSLGMVIGAIEQTRIPTEAETYPTTAKIDFTDSTA